MHARLYICFYTVPLKSIMHVAAQTPPIHGAGKVVIECNLNGTSLNCTLKTFSYLRTWHSRLTDLQCHLREC